MKVRGDRLYFWVILASLSNRRLSFRNGEGKSTLIYSGTPFPPFPLTSQATRDQSVQVPAPNCWDDDDDDDDDDDNNNDNINDDYLNHSYGESKRGQP